jgi:hypothetical protein
VTDTPSEMKRLFIADATKVGDSVDSCRDPVTEASFACGEPRFFPLRAKTRHELTLSMREAKPHDAS